MSTALALTSCSHQYSIKGDVTNDMARGQMLYLSVSNDMQTICHIDSCQIVHGRFNIMGETDSVILARLYVDREMLMPLVLEGGDMNVKIDYYSKTVQGGELNALLNDYFLKMSELQTKWETIYDRRIQLYMSGDLKPHIHAELEAQESNIRQLMEHSETEFIKQNYTNAIGPGMFHLLTERMPLPLLTPQIVDILNNAPQEFLNAPFVSYFIRVTGYKQHEKKRQQDK